LEGSADAQVSNIIRDLIGYEMTALRALREDKQPYALLARQLTDEFFGSADGFPEVLKHLE